MTNLPKTPGEAYEAGLREGAKRTIERIAEMMAGDMKCPPGKCPRSDCRGHWMQYLTEEGGE